MAVPAAKMHAVPQSSKKVCAKKKIARAKNEGRLYLLGNTDGARERIVVEIPSDPGPERCRALDAIYSAEATSERIRKCTNEANGKRTDLADVLNDWPRMRALPRSLLADVEWMDWTAVLASEALEALDAGMNVARERGEDVSLGDHARQLLRYAASNALRLAHEQPPAEWVVRLAPLPAPIKMRG